MIPLKIKKEMISIDEVKIPASFAKSKPRKRKMEECRTFYEKHEVQDRYVVLNKDNYCIDGYIMYLVLKEKGEKYVEVIYARKSKKLHRKNKWQIFESKIRKFMVDVDKW